MVRSGGYNGFSFREIASSIGIKSASVHHHFPTKEDLILEIAKQYQDNFFQALGEPHPAGTNTKNQLEHYCRVFQTAFESTGRACLCGVLANEAEQLPSSVRYVVHEFVKANIIWLEKAMSPEIASGRCREKAEMIYCALEGAMGIAALAKDGKWVERVSSIIVQLVFPHQ